MSNAVIKMPELYGPNAIAEAGTGTGMGVVVLRASLGLRVAGAESDKFQAVELGGISVLRIGAAVVASTSTFACATGCWASGAGVTTLSTAGGTTI